MPLTCNIDARGKSLRMIIGMFFLLDGMTLMLLWGWRTGSYIGWMTSTAMLLIGAFMIFESRKGWCALRAMGINTRI